MTGMRQHQSSTTLKSAQIELRELESKDLEFLHYLERAPRILLAEDCPHTQALLGHILENVGFEVTTADNGSECVQIAKKAAEIQEPFDIALLDIQMPMLNGIVAAAVLRQRGFLGALIAMTGLSESPEEVGDLSSFDYFIPKVKLHEALTPIIVDSLLYH